MDDEIFQELPSFSKEDIYGFTKKNTYQRKLTVPSCPPRTVFFPVLLGGTDQYCGVDVSFTSIEADSNRQILVAGRVDSGTSTTACQVFNNGISGQHDFIALINDKGNYKWIHSLKNNASVQIYSVAMSDLIVFASFVSSDKLRFAKLDSSSGSTQKEISGDDLISLSTSDVIDLQMKADQSDSSLYVSMTITTTSFGYSGQDLVFMKFDSALEQKWIFTLHGSGSYPAMTIVSNYIGVNNFWQLINFQVTSTSWNYGLQKITKTNGAIPLEQIFSNSQPSTLRGVIKLNRNESLWYTALEYGTSYYFSLQSGPTATNTMTKNYYSSEALQELGLAVQEGSGNFVVIGRDSSTQTIRLLEVDYATGKINQAIFLDRGSTASFSVTRLAAISNNGIISIAAESSDFFSDPTKKRIILYQTEDDLDVLSSSCINGTSVSYSNLQSNPTTVSTTSSTLQNTPNNKYQAGYGFFTTLTIQSLVPYAASDPQFTMRDYKNPASCLLPIETDPKILVAQGLSTSSEKNISFSEPSFSDCSGTTFQIITFESSNGLVDTNTMNRYPAGQISFSIIQNLTFSGDYSIRFKVTSYVDTRYVYLKLRIPAINSLVLKPSLQKHQIITCEESIYPFMYGFTKIVYLNDFQIDQYGNMLLAGQGYKTPFGDPNYGNGLGFVTLQDQRGQKLWHLTFKFMPRDQNVDCHSLSYQIDFTYAGCSFPSELFLGGLDFLHLLKVNHTSGAIIYFKKLPNDKYAPQSQRLLNLIPLDTNNNVLSIYSYSTLAGSKRNIALLSFNENSDAINYFKFLNYLDRTDFEGSNTVLVNSSANSFFLIRHQLTDKVAVLKGSALTGSMTIEAKLNDVDTADGTSCYPTFYLDETLLIPVISQTVANSLIVYQLKQEDLSAVQAIKIQFTTAYTISSASIAYDDLGNIYISASQKQLYFAKLDKNFNAENQRLWTGTGSSFYMYSKRAIFYKCSTTQLCTTSEVLYAFQGTIGQTGKTSDGFMIFRGTTQDNCFDMLDIDPSNITWYPTISAIASPQVVTQPMSDSSESLSLTEFNLPIIYEVYNYLARNNQQQSDYTVLNKWGEIELDDFYKRYPLNGFKCGMVARIKKRSSTIIEYKYGSTDKSIYQDDGPYSNCQGKRFNYDLLTTLTNAQKRVFSASSNTITMYLSKYTDAYVAQSFKYQFQDAVDSSMYQFDQPILYRYVANYNITDTLNVHNVSQCSQSPFPLGLEQSSSSNVIIHNIVANETDQSFYIAGQTSNTISFADSNEADGEDALIFRSSQTGSIIWLNQVNFQLNKAEAALAIALGNNHVYCAMNLTLETYSTNNVVLLKITRSEGKLVWSKKLIVRNLVDGMDMYLVNFYDLMSSPRDRRYIMASVLYSWNQNKGQVPGNIMIYDNQTDISTKYDFQYKSLINQTCWTNPGQIFFDHEQDIAYLSAQLNTTDTAYFDVFVHAIWTANGSQIWNFSYPQTLSSTTNFLKPALTVNNLTKNLYVATNHNTKNLWIASLNKQTGAYNKMAHLSLTSDNSYYTFDMVADHKSGNLVIAGQGTSSFSVYYLDKDLARVNGAWDMHYAYQSAIGRQVASFYDYYYIAYNSRYFSNSEYYKSQIVIQKKSFDDFNMYKFECHDYSSQSNYYQITTLTPSSVIAPQNIIYFSNKTLWFQADDKTRFRMLNLFYSTKARFSSDYYDGLYVSGSNDKLYCRDQTGRAGPQTYIPYPIEIKFGESGTFLIRSNDVSHQTCQGENITTSTVINEQESTTFSKSYLTYDSSSTPNKIIVNAAAMPPYPGVRWIGIYISNGAKSSYSYLPIYIYPQIMPKAPATKPDPQCPDNDQQYPKIISHEKTTANTQFYGGDIDQQNGNIVMCGSTFSSQIIMKEFQNGQIASWIMMFDQNGLTSWALSGASVNNTGNVNEGSSYVSCEFGANFTGVFGLVYVDGLAYRFGIVKHEYFTGKVLYIVQLQGYYYQYYYYNYHIIRVDRSSNQIYFSGQRNDLWKDNDKLWNNYVTKIDASSHYPSQQYYSYSTVQTYNNKLNPQTLTISQTDDYFFTLANLLTTVENYYTRYYTSLALYKKSTGVLVKIKGFRKQMASTSSDVIHDAIYDGTNIYYGECASYYPKLFHIVKLSVPSLTVSLQNQHSMVDGYSLCSIALANYTDFVYAFIHEAGYTNKYLTKIKKSDLTFTITSQQAQKFLMTFSFNDQSTQSWQIQKIFVYDEMIYLMMNNVGYIRPISTPVLHQFNLAFQPVKSCVETISYTPYPKSFSFYNEDDIGSTMNFNYFYGSTNYPHFTKFYYEYIINPDSAKLSDATQMNCRYQAPRFTNDMMTNVLTDQIIQLPLVEDFTYTFQWPSDCFEQDLDFSWSVDNYATPPTFFNFTNTSSTSTFTVNSTLKAIVGSYTVRTTFIIRNRPSISSDFTFVVEIYPEQNYGKEQIACPSKNILAVWSTGSTYTEYLMMDMDAAGTNFLMCGRTRDPLLSNHTSSFIGFISSFTKGLNLNFHLSLKIGHDVTNCYAYYGIGDQIQTVFLHISSSSGGRIDSIALIRYSKLGKYSLGKHIQRYGVIDVSDYQIDLSTGHQYITGSHYQTQFNKGSSTEIYILKLDSDYRFIYFRTYETGTQAYTYNSLYGLKMRYNALNSFHVFNAPYTSYYRFLGYMGVSQSDGSIIFQRGLMNTNYMSNNNLQPPSGYPTPNAIALANGYLYIATSYLSYLSYYVSNMGTQTITGYENYLLKANIGTGLFVQGYEWKLSTSNAAYYIALEQSASNPNQLVLSWSYTSSYLYIATIYIGSSSFTFTSRVMTLYLSTSPTSYFSRTHFFERDSVMWGFSRQSSSFSGASDNYGHLFKFRDFVSPSWDESCSAQSTSGDYFYYQDAPIGYIGAFLSSSNITNLNDFPLPTNAFQLLTVWSAPSKLFYRWYTNLQNYTQYPITNQSANRRISIGDCPISAIPTPPVIQNRVGQPVNSSYGGFAVMKTEQNMVLPPFIQCSGESMTYSLKYKNNTLLSSSSLLQFDSQMLFISIFATTNDFVGQIQLTYTATLASSSSLFASVDFIIQVVKNQAPVPKLSFQKTVQIYAHHDYNWTIQFDSDNENDVPQFNVRVTDYWNQNINNSISWLYVNQSDETGMIFSVVNPNQTLSSYYKYCEFTVSVLVWDEFNVATPNVYNFTLRILPNYGPYLAISYYQYIGTIFITQGFTWTIWYQNFTDAEGDQVIISTSVSTSNYQQNTNWIKTQVNQTKDGNITFYGKTPRDNSFSGNYHFTLVVKDQWEENTRSYTWYYRVEPKAQIEVQGEIDNEITQVPNKLEMLFQNQSQDPLGEPNYYSLYVNSTIYDESLLGEWIFWNNATQNLTIIPFNNSFIGNHTIWLRYDDYVTSPIYNTFKVEVIPNWPLQALTQEIPNRIGIVDNWFFFDYNKSELFFNPEGNPFTMYFRLSQNGNALPYFISKNFSNGTIGGYPTAADVGIYSMECVGIDDALWETVYPFLLTIKPCYYKCQKCWDAEYKTCTGCRPGYYLYNSECVDICVDGTYHDSAAWKCLLCPYQCKTCTGSNTMTQCPTCNPGFYALTNGCYEKCPDGYYPDKTDYTCKLCHPACTLCFGPSSKQCYNCTELFSLDEIGYVQKVGYLLQQTSCILPKCIVGQYFSWYSALTNGIAQGRCLQCHPRCQRCTGPESTQCSSCYPGALLNSIDHTCTYCEEIPGLFTNEQLQCEDICGDGIIKNKQCDDGNIESGDGCSNQCQIEYGYGCPTPNAPCKEIIPPGFSIQAISSINQIFIQFSEPVLISDISDISRSNLQISIVGSKDQYTFDWRLIEDSSNPLLPNKKITKFSLIIEGYKQSMDGSEQIVISFKNTTGITDQVGNQMANNYYSQINANPFIYLSASETDAAAGSASSMKYTFLSVFSFNLILKVALSSSMQYLWGLVHALQVFSFLLYMNINFPENVQLFTQYFSVASGDLDEFNAYIPNIAEYIVDENNIVQRADDQNLAPPFLENEISPYFIIAYGQKLTIWTFAFLILLPSVLLMNKLCKKVKVWENIKSSFFYNSPLRGFVEQYLEFILQLILNTKFMKYGNRDQFISSLIAFVFGAGSVLLPFIAMSIIYQNRKRVSSLKWKRQFGMLTEESQTYSILQLYYYPLFMYQRLMIASVLVYVYEYPMIQCGLIISCCAFMVLYMILVKPFQEENQQTTTVLDEFVIIICVILFAVLESKGDQITTDQQKNLGWLIVAFISFSVIKNFSVVIYFGVTKARKSIDDMFGQEDFQKDSPHTSDDEEVVEIHKMNDNYDNFDTEELRKEILENDATKFDAFVTKLDMTRANLLTSHDSPMTKLQQ